ncbi:hypothetical protein TTHN1_01594 [Thermus thermophilus]|uniref:Uncharacterized protein n=1 Tax=Thermus thermophilus TaxID=274 RepID=A0A3P4ATS1_THETH|nr:hypothetical protein [Thermus thermophilus]VCU53808.1 hypothetical protein TTHN1_01594 [Thermus thermophilus]
MGEKVEVVQNRVSLWQAYKQGVGVGLGILTVYALALLLLGFLASRALASAPSGGNEPPKNEGGKACSTSWV